MQNRNSFNFTTKLKICKFFIVYLKKHKFTKLLQCKFILAIFILQLIFYYFFTYLDN